MRKPWTHRLWLWLAAYARRKAIQTAPGCQRRCPHCLHWTSEAPARSWVEDERGRCTMTCGWCGKPSYWWQTGIIPVLEHP